MVSCGKDSSKKFCGSLDGKTVPHWEVIDEKTLILRNQHHFLTTYIGDALNVHANRTNLESRISAGAIEKLPGWEKPLAKTVAWWRGSKMCGTILRIGEQKDRATVQSLKPLLGRSSKQKGRT